MSLPRKLKNFNLFVDGGSFVGRIPELTLPKLTRKTEDYQGGGMRGPVKSCMGMETLEMEFTCGGYERDLLAKFGVTGVSGVLLRFAGALQADDSAAIPGIHGLEVVVRGYFEAIDFGTAKPQDKTEVKVSCALSYYKLTLDNRTLIEFDMVNMVEIIDGEDLAAADRIAMGL